MSALTPTKSVETQTAVEASVSTKSARPTTSSKSVEGDLKRKRQQSRTASSTRSATRSSSKKSKKTAFKERVQDVLQVCALPLLISFLFQVVMVLFIAFEMFNLTGENLLYLVGAMVLFLLSLFFSLEVLLSRRWLLLWIGVSGIYSLLAMALSIATLVCAIRKSQELEETADQSARSERIAKDWAFLQRLAAVTTIVMFCHMLVLTHSLYQHFVGRKNKKNDEEGDGKSSNIRIAGGLESAAAEPRRLPPAVVEAKPRQQPPSQKKKRAPMAYMIDAELQPVT